MRTHRLLVAAALLGALTACTVEKTGSPNPGNGGQSRSNTANSSRAPSSSSTSTARVLPQRPRELDLTGVNPCTDVLTRDQLHQLAYDLGYQRKPQAGKSDIHGGQACLYASTSPPDQPSRDIASLITISTSEGAEAWLNDPRRKRSPDQYRVTTILGFPALILPNPAVVDNCDVVVDVHSGQYLEVNPSSGGSKRGTSPDPYCAEGQRVAELVVQNLLARR